VSNKLLLNVSRSKVFQARKYVTTPFFIGLQI